MSASVHGTDLEPLARPPSWGGGGAGGRGGGGADELEEMGGGGTGYVGGVGAGTAAAEEDEEYFPTEWQSGRRGSADVLSLAGDVSGVSRGGGGGGGSRSGGGSGSGCGGGGEGSGDYLRVRSGVEIVDETPSLLDGDFDEAANEASFADALKEWRGGGRHDPGRPTTASLATMEVHLNPST